MKAWKILVPVVLGAAALGGFAYAASQTNGGKGTPPAPSTGNDVRVQIIPHRDGGYAGVVVVNGVTQDAIIGPMATVKELEAQIAAYMAGQDVDAFYTVSSDEKGRFFAQEWSRGEPIATEGPFASEAAANTAGSNWAVAQTAGAAVGGSGCPSCDEKKRRMAAARARR